MKFFRRSLISTISLFVGIGYTFAQEEVEIQVNNTANLQDDFLCWNPIPARIRLLEGQQESRRVKIGFESSAEGEVGFSRDTGVFPDASTIENTSEIELLLPGDGSWVPFFVSGTQATKIENVSMSKDVLIVANDSDSNNLVAQLPVMVRVRKDAESLTQAEQEIFLQALAELHGHNRSVGHGRNYIKYAEAHAVAFRNGIHGGDIGFPLFLAWHRAFLLSIERELQEIDPRVTIPYWAFDSASSSIFTENFMGVVGLPGEASQFEVKFSPTNPLHGWVVNGSGSLRRIRNGNLDLSIRDDSFVTYVDSLADLILEEGATEYRGDEAENGINSRIEDRYHNGAHSYVRGWLTTLSSPRDPMFYLLHANVDRAWAEWQAKYDRFDPNDPASYPEQGAFPGDDGPSSRWPKSSYQNDIMWP